MAKETKKSSLKTLTSIERAFIARRLSCNESITVLAREFGISCRTIRRMSEKKENVYEEPMASTSSEESTRKKQTMLDLETREIIINRLDAGRTIEGLSLEYGVSSMTIRRIKKNKEDILKQIASVRKRNGNLHMKTVHGSDETLLEKALYAWFVQEKSLGEKISGNMIREQALVMNRAVNGSPNFKASFGWLQRFKERHNIQQLYVPEGKLSLDEMEDSAASISFNKLLEDREYDSDQVYNADECGLYWKAVPKRTSITNNERNELDSEETEERVSLMFCANASGTHKLPLFVIGKPVAPRCFENIEVDKLPVKYIGQENAWVDCNTLLHWYREVFLPEVQEKHPNTAEQPRKVLLIIDNAPSHPHVDELNTIDETCQVEYLPPNETASIQPMMQGIIEKTKMLYRKDWIQELLLQRDEESVYARVENLDMKDFCRSIANAWDQITEIDIQIAWNKLLKNQNRVEHPGAYHLELMHFLSIIKRLPGFEQCSYKDAKAWAEADCKDNGWEYLDTDKILKRFKNGLPDKEDPENNDESIIDSKDNINLLSFDPPACKVPPIEEAIQGLDTFFKWFETCPECTTEDLITLQRLKVRSLNLL